MSERTKMGRRRDANADVSSDFYQERRKEIVDEAARAFQERGFQATTIGVIAERLHTDRASIYYYFGSKQELFREVVREVGLKAVEDAELIAASDWPAEKKLSEAFQAVMESYSRSYPYMHVFLQENFPVVHEANDDWSAEARDWGRRYYLAIRRIVQQGVDEKKFHLTLPVSVTTMGVLGTVNWAHRWYKPGGSLGPRVIGEGFAKMILVGLTSPVEVPTTKKSKSIKAV
jgi:AcrR family transcriptional regulator